MIYDITRRVSPELGVWDGDAPYLAQPVAQLADGDFVNLTTITLSPHTGSHADAYYHFAADGAAIADMPLDAYLGRAQVVHVTRCDGALMPEDFAHVDLRDAERLVIRSCVSDRPETHFSHTFPYLSLPLIEWLETLNIRLVGLDSPSVDAFDSTTLPSHHALKKAGIVNLESLYLPDVPEGCYELIALPLKLAQTCGSPVRAILRTL